MTTSIRIRSGISLWPFHACGAVFGGEDLMAEFLDGALMPSSVTGIIDNQDACHMAVSPDG